MASKRDQLQAYQFLAQRVISALVTRQSDPEHPPFRRPGTAAVGSIAIAVIALAVVGVYGILVPGGNKAWRDGKSVIVVQETGARYVYLNGHLDQVLNYSSALLAIGQQQHANTVTVSRNSLLDVPRGPLIGIPDAPDSLPGADRILSGGWSLCSQPGLDPTGATVDESVLLVGDEPTGAAPLADAALLVDVPDDGGQYLIWHGYRHQLNAPDAVTVGLGLRPEPRERAGMSFVDGLPAGDPIGPISVPQAGAPSTAVPGRADIRVGQLLTAQNPGDAAQHYLAEPSRLLPISALQYDIQLAYGPTAAAYAGAQPIGVPLGLVEAADAAKEPTPTPTPAAAPAQRPTFVGSGRDTAAVCATYDDDSATPRLRVDAMLPPADVMAPTDRSTNQGAPLADRVYVRPGWAALVEVMPSAAAPTGSAVVLVTDQGRSYPLANRGVPTILGYGGVRPVRLPSGIVARVPQGAGLDPKAALGNESAGTSAG